MQIYIQGPDVIQVLKSVRDTANYKMDDKTLLVFCKDNKVCIQERKINPNGVKGCCGNDIKQE